MADDFANLGFVPHATDRAPADDFSSLGFMPHAPEPAKPGYAESAARGGAQGLSLGFADELSGAKNALLDAARGQHADPSTLENVALASPIGLAGTVARGGANLLTGKTSVSDIVKNYIAHRDQYRSADKAAKEANPWTYNGTQLAGGVAGTFVPGLNAVKGAGALAKIGQVAGLGAVQGIGSSEADNAGDLAKDAALGSGVGLAGMGAGNLLSRAIPTAQGSASLAVRKAIEHLRPTPKVARVLGPQRLGEIGREALDSGAIQFGAKAGATAERLGENRDVLGKGIGEIVDNSEARINPKTVADKFDKEVIEPLRGQAANKDIVAKLEQQKSDFLEHYMPEGEATTISPKQLEEEKRAVNGGINYLTDPKNAQKAQMGYANVLKTESENAIDNPDFLDLKSKFGKTAEAQAMAERTAGLTDHGTGLIGHLYDMGAGNLAGEALLHGNPVTAAATVGTRALARGRTASAIAVGADKAGKFMAANPLLDKAAQGLEGAVQRGGAVYGRQNAPYTENQQPTFNAETLTSQLSESPEASKFVGAIKSAAARGPESLAATHFILSQTQPEYQKATQK